MSLKLVHAAVLVVVLSVVFSCAQGTDLSGLWRVTIEHHGATEYGALTLKPVEGVATGEMFGDIFTATLNDGQLVVRCHNKDAKGKECGLLKGRLSDGTMTVSGVLYKEESSWTARRPAAIQRTSKRHEFMPKVYCNEFSARIEPVLKISPGDTVHTTTVDAGGVDANGAHPAAGGNPLTGPFYVEGAWPGDVLVIKLNRVRLNRDTAGTYSDSVVLSALDPYYVRDRKKVENFDATWKLDRQNSFATLTKPTEPMRNFQVKLSPMMGCIGVAPGGGEAFRSGRLGNFGGNLDYNQMREGITFYLPVFQPGALLFVGDGHAAQGDGELTGNALETSMDVEFTVDLAPDHGLRQPHAENDDFLMVMGIENSLDEALRSATTGMSQWLESAYKLNYAEIAMVLGSSMRYDIAEIVDPKVNLVAKVPKAVLARIEKAKQ